jgi:hypothetical protein
MNIKCNPKPHADHLLEALSGRDLSDPAELKIAFRLIVRQLQLVWMDGARAVAKATGADLGDFTPAEVE